MKVQMKLGRLVKETSEPPAELPGLPLPQPAPQRTPKAKAPSSTSAERASSSNPACFDTAKQVPTLTAAPGAAEPVKPGLAETTPGCPRTPVAKPSTLQSLPPKPIKLKTPKPVISVMEDELTTGRIKAVTH